MRTTTISINVNNSGKKVEYTFDARLSSQTITTKYINEDIVDVSWDVESFKDSVEATSCVNSLAALYDELNDIYINKYSVLGVAYVPAHIERELYEAFSRYEEIINKEGIDIVGIPRRRSERFFGRIRGNTKLLNIEEALNFLDKYLRIVKDKSKDILSYSYPKILTGVYLVGDNIIIPDYVIKKLFPCLKERNGNITLVEFDRNIKFGHETLFKYISDLSEIDTDNLIFPSTIADAIIKLKK